MRSRLILTATIALAITGDSYAWDNSACWGDAARVEISCVPLTEKLLSSLKHASRLDVTKAMRSDGRQLGASEGDTLHFVGNAKRGNTGILHVRFEADRVVIVRALIDRTQGGPLEYLWNSELGECSDFPGSDKRCNKR